MFLDSRTYDLPFIVLRAEGLKMDVTGLIPVMYYILKVNDGGMCKNCCPEIYLLTYSTVQSPTSEANRFAASQ